MKAGGVPTHKIKAMSSEEAAAATVGPPAAEAAAEEAKPEVVPEPEAAAEPEAAVEASSAADDADKVAEALANVGVSGEKNQIRGMPAPLQRIPFPPGIAKAHIARGVKGGHYGAL